MIASHSVDQFIGLLATEQSNLSSQLSSPSTKDEDKKRILSEVKEINSILAMLYKYKENQLPKTDVKKK
jgi:hypothetical protein